MIAEMVNKKRGQKSSQNDLVAKATDWGTKVWNINSESPEANPVHVPSLQFLPDCLVQNWRITYWPPKARQLLLLVIIGSIARLVVVVAEGSSRFGH